MADRGSELSVGGARTDGIPKSFDQDPICHNANGMGQWDCSSIHAQRYTSRELVKLAEEFGWMPVGVRGDHHNFKHPASRFLVTIVHPQKDVPVGRAVDTVKKIKLEIK